MKKDIGVLGKGKSDPYALINIGAQEFRTQTIDNNVNPKWDYWCEVRSLLSSKLIVLLYLLHLFFFTGFFFTHNFAWTRFLSFWILKSNDMKHEMPHSKKYLKTTHITDHDLRWIWSILRTVFVRWWHKQWWKAWKVSFHVDIFYIFLWLNKVLLCTFLLWNRFANQFWAAHVYDSNNVY